MRSRAAARVMAILVVVAACTSTSTGEPSSSSTAVPGQPASGPIATPAATPNAAVPGSLGEALDLVGPIPMKIHFTDWTRIKALANATALTGASAFEDKAVALRNEAPLSAFGLTDLRTHAADWGFDVMDLEWEALSDPGLVYVLRFRDGFDLAIVAAKLDAYGFATESLPHGVLRTGSLANFRVGDRFLSNTNFANTGFLDDGRTLVLSVLGAGRGDPIRGVLMDGPKAVVDLSLRSVARLLDGPSAAALFAGSCETFSAGLQQVAPDIRAEMDALLAATGPLAPFNALAVGYGGAGPITGRIVFGYPEEGQADADLGRRRDLVANGISTRSRDPAALVRYPDRFFTVSAASVQERAVVIEVIGVAFTGPTPTPGSIVGPTDRLPRGLVDTIVRRDMLYASC